MDIISTRDAAINLTREDIGILNKDGHYIEYVFLNYCDNKEIEEYCLNNKMNLNFKINDAYETPLLISLLDDYKYDIFKKLVDLGANINIKNNKKVYPLINIFESLIDKMSSNTNYTTKEQFLSDIKKYESKIIDIVDFVINHKSDVNSVCDSFKLTPIGFAKKFGLSKIEKILIEAGAK